MSAFREAQVQNRSVCAKPTTPQNLDKQRETAYGTVPLVRAPTLSFARKPLWSVTTGPIFRAATSLMREASKPWLTADGRVRRTRLVAQGLPSKFLRLISNRSRLHQQLRAFVCANSNHSRKTGRSSVDEPARCLAVSKSDAPSRTRT